MHGVGLPMDLSLPIRSENATSAWTEQIIWNSWPGMAKRKKTQECDHYRERPIKTRPLGPTVQATKNIDFNRVFLISKMIPNKI